MPININKRSDVNSVNGKVGDVVTIMAFGVFSLEEARNFHPRVIVLNEKNEIVLRKGTRSI